MKKNLYLLKNYACPLFALILTIGGDNLKKIFKSLVVIITMLFLLTPICFGADDVNFKTQIKKEDRKSI
jgi:hypothetical protein